MGKMIIKKFNSSMADDSILKLGEIRLTRFGNERTWGGEPFVAASENGVQVNVLSDYSPFVGDVKTLTLGTGGFSVDLKNETEATPFIISIADKYKIVRFNNTFFAVDLKDLKYGDLEQLYCGTNVVLNGGTFTLDELYAIAPNLTAWHLPNCVGTIARLAELYGDSVSWFTLHNCVHITGTFDDLGSMKLVTSYGYSIINPPLTGTVEGFVANKIAKGVTSGTATFYWLGDGGRITFKGQPIENVENNTIAWDGTSITVNGVS